MSTWQWIYRFLLLAAGWVFFLVNDPAAIIWLVAITVIGYAIGLEIGRIKELGETPGRRAEAKQACKGMLAVAIVVIAGLLVFFKYGDIITGQRFIVPLGLSYYSLMVIGYLIDVYRGEISAEKSILIFALYVSFFPQITAGPIGRGKELLETYRKRITLSTEDIKAGLLMIALGVYEKFVMADNLSMVVDGLVEAKSTGTTLAVAFLLYSFVIYYDFSGYSLIAIGLGRLMGVRLTDNFHAPYLAVSIKEFWRRWHISLSSWFRDYLYIPLGGSKKGHIRRDLNTVLVFVVSGAWHGQAIGFWLWGLFHGLFLVIENNLRGLFKNIKCSNKAVKIPANMLKRALVFIMVSFAWIPFYAGDPDKTFILYDRLFSSDKSFFSGLQNGFGLRVEIWIVLGVSFIFYLVLAVLDEHFKYTLYEKMARHGALIFVIAIVLYTFLLLAGTYGTEYEASQFIYGGF